MMNRVWAYSLDPMPKTRMDLIDKLRQITSGFLRFSQYTDTERIGNLQTRFEKMHLLHWLALCMYKYNICTYSGEHVNKDLDSSLRKWEEEILLGYLNQNLALNSDSGWVNMIVALGMPLLFYLICNFSLVFYPNALPWLEISNGIRPTSLDLRNNYIGSHFVLAL